MTEKVVVKQNNKFETEITPLGAKQPDAGKILLAGVDQPLSPMMLLLASLGSCTASVLHTYAQSHNLDLEAVEIQLAYEHAASTGHAEAEDGTSNYGDLIRQKVNLTGTLDDSLKRRIFLICRRCSIHSILEAGTEIQSELVEDFS